MTAPNNGRLGRGPLLLVIVPIAFLLARPWLKSTFGDSMASLAGAAAAIFVVSYANYLAFRHHRRLDEVQRAGAGFAAQWGVPAGQFAFVLLMVLPPFKDWATQVVGEFAGVQGVLVDRHVVFVAMMLGFCGVVFLQTLGVLIVNTYWWKERR